MANVAVFLISSIMIIIVVVIMMVFAMRILQPNECAVLVVMGRPQRILLPGYNFVPPIISKVHRIKMDSPMWESELKKYKSKLFPEFSEKIEKFRAEAKDNYGFLGK
jgi:regulator of protease activity HflC (stomatin/prohibitin superfamily)